MEYESLFALGSLCGIDDPDVVLQAARQCDDMGLDTISAGGTIAFAMECQQRGLLDNSWLRFGDGGALLRAIDEIARRHGIGDALAEGSRHLAHKIGHDAITFAPQVKGLEIPGYEPRELQTMALGFAVATRGADHNRSAAYEVDFSANVDRRNPSDDAVELAVHAENKATLMDSLILCKFLRGVFDDFYVEAAEMLNLVTGWDTTAEELAQISHRIVTAKKLFNVRAGWTPQEDTLPARFFSKLADDPAARLHSESLARQIRLYNQRRGWSTDGWPETPLLDQLGLAGI
jgi:aldehyde:ferredoxin oxidoreductase